MEIAFFEDLFIDFRFYKGAEGGFVNAATKELVERLRSKISAAPARIVSELAALSLYSGCELAVTGKKGTFKIVAAILNAVRRGNRQDEAARFLMWFWAADNKAFFEMLSDLDIKFENPPQPDETLISRALAAETSKEEKAQPRQRGVGAAIHIQNVSDYDVPKIFDHACSTITIIAQNHYRLLHGKSNYVEANWERIKACLIRGVDIEIIAMHPSVPPRQGEFWSQQPPDAGLLWSYFMDAHEFSAQLQKTWEVLSQWHELASKLQDSSQQVGSLEIYGCYFAPFSMTVVDRLEEDSFIVLSPRTTVKESGTRPHFVIERQAQPEAFSHFAQVAESFTMATGARLWPFQTTS